MSVESNFSFDPPLSQFEELSKSFDLIAVQARFSADSETPSAYVKLSDQKPAFLFESVVGESKSVAFLLWDFLPARLFPAASANHTLGNRFTHPKYPDP